MLGSVVRKMDSVTHWIVIFYPVLKMILNTIKLNNNTLAKLLVPPLTLKC